MTARPQALRINDVCQSKSARGSPAEKEKRPTFSSSPGQGRPADSLAHNLKNSWNWRE